jgi:uncharacterized protein Yka (UPF0111/DUF47 family)
MTKEERPNPECKLFMEGTVKDHIHKMALSVQKLALATEKLAESYDEQKRVLHGANMDNGLVLRVKELETKCDELRQMPKELRSTIMKWGFALITIQIAGNGIFLAIIAHLMGVK